MTDKKNPILLSGGQLARATSPRNNRSRFPVDFDLLPDRVYRVVARVTDLRGSPIHGPVLDGELTTDGGLSFRDSSPWSGGDAAGAKVDATQIYLALRFRHAPAGAWADLGQSLAGSNGAPRLDGSGDLSGGSTATLTLTNALPSATSFFVFGDAPGYLPFAGGVIVPTLDLVFATGTDSSGGVSLTGIWPNGIPGGTTIYVQACVVDPGGPRGFDLSNAIAGVAAY